MAIKNQKDVIDFFKARGWYKKSSTKIEHLSFTDWNPFDPERLSIKFKLGEDVNVLHVIAAFGKEGVNLSYSEGYFIAGLPALPKDGGFGVKLFPDEIRTCTQECSCGKEVPTFDEIVPLDMKLVEEEKSEDTVAEIFDQIEGIRNAVSERLSGVKTDGIVNPADIRQVRDNVAEYIDKLINSLK